MWGREEPKQKSGRKDDMKEGHGGRKGIKEGRKDMKEGRGDVNVNERRT